MRARERRLLEYLGSYSIVDKLLNKETKKSDYKPDPFGVDEINSILNASEGQVRLLFQFAFFTGLRVSELIGLRWEDVDWQNQLIHVEETIVANLISRKIIARFCLSDQYLNTSRFPSVALSAR